MLLDYTFDWTVISDNWQNFLAGAWVDVWVTAVGFAAACLIGLFIATMARSHTRIIIFAADAYIQVVRGIPLYIVLLWVYFGIAEVLSVLFTPIQAVILSLAVTGSGYTAEIFRGGLLAVEPGQREAALALGLTPRQVLARVELPQAVRIVIPPLGNTFVGLLKGATIMSVIAVPDMVLLAMNINTEDFKPFEAFTAVGIILLGLVLALSALTAFLERALRIP